MVYLQSQINLILPRSHYANKTGHNWRKNEKDCSSDAEKRKEWEESKRLK